MKVVIYDTTLRDGAQSPYINFTLQDKIKIAKTIANELGVDYIEGGFAASNPKDMEFFQKIKEHDIRAKISAFCSTIKPYTHPKEDENLKKTLSTGVDVICVFGKSWDLHVKKTLLTTLQENLRIIKDTISFLKEKKKEVIYDAEHFFDGFKSNPDYAILTLLTAQEAGADTIVLCDTNGGCLPYQIQEIIRQVKKEIKISLGIHAHNDSDCAVANTIVAVKEGCLHVQGTINGYGERCGNANLISVIANLQVKLNYLCIPKENLKKLTEVARYVAEVANQALSAQAPYVGEGAFAHKGGVHIDGVCKEPSTYEHINPSVVGNERKLLVSELIGRSGIAQKIKNIIKIDKKDQIVKKIVDVVKKYEKVGFHFEDAEGSFELLVKRLIGEHKPHFKLLSFRVIVEKRGDEILSEATLKIEVDKKPIYTVAEGDGPVHALDNALRAALTKFYPQLKDIHLTDYKVRVLDAQEGTAAKVRVLIETTNNKGESWNTIGVSENIIEASWDALVDSIEYALNKERGGDKR